MLAASAAPWPGTLERRDDRASKQRVEAKPGMSHQQRIDLKREGEADQTDAPGARPGSRDADRLDHERFPRG